jgi:hypothetical protein
MTVVSARDVTQLAAPSPNVAGGVMRGSLGAVVPVTALGPITDSSVVDLGIIGDTGLVRTEDRQNTDVFDWGGNLVATLQDRYALTLKFSFLQVMNADVAMAAYGDSNVSVTPPTTNSGTELRILMNNKLLDNATWIFDGTYQNINMRLVVPIARITQLGDVTWVHNKLCQYDVTLKPFPDSSGNHAYQYWNDGITTV